MSNTLEIITEIVIDAPKERVFELLTNLAEYQNWNPFIVESKGTVKVGNILTNTMKNGDSQITFKPKVMCVEPNKKFEWLGKLWIGGLFDGHHYFHIIEINANRVNLVHGERFSGILAKLLLQKIGTETRNNFVAMNNALKQLAEKP